jgi:hypothetical protein
MNGGAGGDWGQRVGIEYFVSAVNSDNIHIVLHEMGHTFGLDDFYDWTPTGQSNFVLLAGCATSATEFDDWVFRDWWRHVKSRYGLLSGGGKASESNRRRGRCRSYITAPLCGHSPAPPCSHGQSPPVQCGQCAQPCPCAQPPSSSWGHCPHSAAFPSSPRACGHSPLPA